MLDRTVTVVPRTVTGTDARGNEIIADGTPIEDVRAARSLAGSSEELEGRDQVSDRWTYVLAVFADDGTPLALDARSRIIDGDETFELEGTPSEARRRRRGVLNHLEARVYRIEG